MERVPGAPVIPTELRQYKQVLCFLIAVSSTYLKRSIHRLAHGLRIPNGSVIFRLSGYPCLE